MKFDSLISELHRERPHYQDTNVDNLYDFTRKVPVDKLKLSLEQQRRVQQEQAEREQAEAKEQAERKQAEREQAERKQAEASQEEDQVLDLSEYTEVVRSKELKRGNAYKPVIVQNRAIWQDIKVEPMIVNDGKYYFHNSIIITDSFNYGKLMSPFPNLNFDQLARPPHAFSEQLIKDTEYWIYDPVKETFHENPELFEEVVPKAQLKNGNSYKPISNSVVIVTDGEKNYIRSNDIPTFKDFSRLVSITESQVRGQEGEVREVINKYNFYPDIDGRHEYWLPKSRKPKSLEPKSKPSSMFGSLFPGFTGGKTRSQKKSQKKSKKTKTYSKKKRSGLKKY